MITTIISSLIAAVISAMISGIFVTRINKKIDSRQQEEEKKENTMNEYNLLILKGIIASLSLGEATADAFEETGKHNDKQKQARMYAEEVKHDLQNFVYKLSAENLN